MKPHPTKKQVREMFDLLNKLSASLAFISLKSDDPICIKKASDSVTEIDDLLDKVNVS